MEGDELDGGRAGGGEQLSRGSDCERAAGRAWLESCVGSQRDIEACDVWSLSWLPFPKRGCSPLPRAIAPSVPLARRP